MLPLLQREVVQTKQWTSEAELLDYYSVAQVTPGIIAVNTAMFVGHQQKGPAGAFFSMLGMLAPSVIIITAFSSLISAYSTHPMVLHAFAGIRVALCALIIHTLYTLSKRSLVDLVTVLICLGSFLLLLREVTPPVPLVLSALLGLFFYLRRAQ